MRLWWRALKRSWRRLRFSAVWARSGRGGRRAAGYYRELRRRGQTVRGTVDCLIASFCLQHGHLLLHRDRGFDRFEQELGLRVLHPEAHRD